MKAATLVGVLLVLLGVVSLAYQGFTYTTREKILDIGPIVATRETQKTIPLPPVLGGIALVGGPLLWLFAWDRLSDRVRKALCLSIALAAIGATFLAVNLHLANAASHPWLFPSDAFDEGIDLDSVLPAIQIAIATVSIILFRRLGQSDASNDIETNS